MGRKKQRKSEWLVDAAMPAATVPRRLRVEGDVHQQLVRALQDMGDRRIQRAAITRVQMTDDLQLASVYVRPAVTTSEADTKAIIAGLNSAKKRLRRHLGANLSLRYTPDLRFFYDRGHDAAQRVDELLAEIAADRASQSGGEDAGGADADVDDADANGAAVGDADADGADMGDPDDADAGDANAASEPSER